MPASRASGAGSGGVDSVELAAGLRSLQLLACDVNYVETLREFPDPKERPRPMSPNAKKRVKFAVARSVNAPTRNVSADDKYQCQKHLLAPHASLLLQVDRTLPTPPPR